MDFFMMDFPISNVETYLFIPPIVAFFISFFTSMGGISGAFLLLPFQVSVLGFTTPAVSSTNLLFNITGTPGGIYRYGKEQRLAWPIALIILSGIIPGVFIGYYLRVKYLPDPRHFKLFVGIVLLYVAIKLLKECWMRRTIADEAVSRVHDNQVEHASIGPIRTGFEFRNKTYSFMTVGLLLLSFLVGIIGGIYGIGGGSIIAPICISSMGLPVHAIAGAVLLGTFASSFTGVIFYSTIPVNGIVAAPDWLLGTYLVQAAFSACITVQRHKNMWMKRR